MSADESFPPGGGRPQGRVTAEVRTTAGRIVTEQRGHVLLMGIDRVAKMNAFDPPMLEGLARAFTELEEGADYRCGVLYAHGPHFTAGLDLAKVAPVLAGGGGLFPENLIDPWAIHGRTRSKPVICAIQGRCLTLGIELMLAQDIVVAAADARFAQIEVKRGLFPFGGATLRWPRLSGWGNAMRYLLTGDEFGAEEARRIGLVQEVVPAGQQLHRAVALAETVAAQAPLGVQATRRSARATLQEGFPAAAAELLPELRRLMTSEDAQEGLQSFLERRAAVFRGR